MLKQMLKPFARAFTFKNRIYNIFYALGIQMRISASFPVKLLTINLPKFTSKEKFGPYFVRSYSRIASIERALYSLLALYE